MSIPIGLTVLIKSVTIGDEATKMQLQTNFGVDTCFIHMNDDEKIYFFKEKRRLVGCICTPFATANRCGFIKSTMMEGELVYPDVVPNTVKKISLVFNEGKNGADRLAFEVIVSLKVMD